MNDESKKSIAIIGYGYVGQAMYRFFQDHYQMYFYTPNNPESASKEQINQCDLAVICVPTPQSENGECDISIVRDTLIWLDTPLILIKSTVPPGTTELMMAETQKNIVFSPEYIGEGKYIVQWWKGYPHPTDMKKHDFVILGGRREDTSAVLEFFKRVLGPDAKYFQTNARTAELTKYMENSWGATKVTFANEFYEISNALGVDYNELRELFLLDGRTERMHTVVFKNKRGFSGKCYPKDVSAIIAHSEKHGYAPNLLKEVVNSNQKFQRL